MRRTIPRLSATFSVLVCLILTSCATNGNFERNLSTWVGVDVHMLLAAWGPPHKTYPLPGGAKIIEYQNPNAIPFGGATYYTTLRNRSHGAGKDLSPLSNEAELRASAPPVYRVEPTCKARFSIDGFGIISKWGWEGNSCKAYSEETVLQVPQTDQTSTVRKENKLTDPQAFEWLARSSDSINHENWAEAIRTASSAIALDPLLEAAYVNRAWAYLQKGLTGEAIEDCNKGLRINTENILLYNYRALAHARTKAFDRAHADLERALKLAPGNGLTRNNVGHLNELNGRSDAALYHYRESCQSGYARACENYRRLAGFSPDDIGKRTAELLDESRDAFLKGDWDAVIAKTTEALRVGPGSEVALTNRAAAYANKRMLKEAREDCDQAIKLNPDYGLAYNNRGYVYEIQGQAKQAGLDYEIGCNLGVEKACENLKRISDRLQKEDEKGDRGDKPARKGVAI